MEQDSPVTLSTLRRGTSVRECLAVFAGSRIDGQLLVNGKTIHIMICADGESLRAWAQEWRKEYQAEGGQDVIAQARDLEASATSVAPSTSPSS